MNEEVFYDELYFHKIQVNKIGVLHGFVFISRTDNTKYTIGPTHFLLLMQNSHIEHGVVAGYWKVVDQKQNYLIYLGENKND